MSSRIKYLRGLGFFPKTVFRDHKIGVDLGQKRELFDFLSRPKPKLHFFTHKRVSGWWIQGVRWIQTRVQTGSLNLSWRRRFHNDKWLLDDAVHTPKRLQAVLHNEAITGFHCESRTIAEHNFGATFFYAAKLNLIVHWPFKRNCGALSLI